MTREKLQEEISALALAHWIQPSVDWVCNYTRALIALIDRYEQEQWTTEPPKWLPYREIVAEAEDGTLVAIYTGWYVDEGLWPWNNLTGRWRELPPGPEGGGSVEVPTRNIRQSSVRTVPKR